MAWQGMQQPFVAPPAGAPSPGVAAVLGLIPGVGAMYNGQFFKGLIHVAIFALLVSLASHIGIFGILIAGWIFYQAFEAYHTAVARRDGLPLPDPLGLNEIGNRLNLGAQNRPPYPGAPGAASGPVGGVSPAGGNVPPPPPPYQAYSPTPGYASYSDPMVPPAPPVPPVPPVPPMHWRRREPIFAVILVGFGLILLLNQVGIVTERAFDFLWPLALIGFGGWLIVRRMGDSRGGSQ
jgi:TM2 domain-containing membrane protein YozV